METDPIYSKPIRPVEKPRGKFSTEEAVKMIASKYDSVSPLNGSRNQHAFIHADSGRDDTQVTEQDIVQVESFFRSHLTEVYVCECLANLYHMNMGPSCNQPASSASSWSSGRSDTSSECSLASSPAWELARTGIPVLLFDKGVTRARSKRQLQIVLAERGTGFALWFDVLDNLSNYRALASTFHAMHCSRDHRQMAGLSFDRGTAATEFLRKVELLTSDPLNISLSVPKSRPSSGKKRNKRSSSAGPPNRPRNKPKPPCKSDISMPCCFQHVTAVEISDREKLYSLASLVPGLEQLSLSPERDSFRRATSSSSLGSSPHRTRSSTDIMKIAV